MSYAIGFHFGCFKQVVDQIPPYVPGTAVNGLAVGAAHVPHILMQQIKKEINNPTLSIIAFFIEVLSVLNQKCVLVPGAEAILLRPDGTHCLPDEPGELYVKAPTAALGYWNDLESTKQDTLKVSGLQVSLTEIEQTILSEPSRIVSDVSAAGIQLPTARTSDDRAPRAWIVLNSTGKALKQEEVKEQINSWVQERLSKFKWLRGGIAIVDSIPRNPTGKALRRTLVEYEAEVNNSPTTQRQAKL
ncbi:hypothetical protein Clacol_010219 [Clathrus columnatus]|uniref:AMP-binding enzyme C-terminal domain-containing protein n=1 Tax=Clathrus columnatus TaxID=1419009 RepID=A0AAV5AVN5_9AGAM|nr:hypothetical protein Clacol_010219 [Clathrus columnatus]